MNILGINAYHGDASACLVQDGVLVAGAAEERFNRQKHWAGFPAQAIRFCLQRAGLKAGDLDHVAISRDPSTHIHDRVLSNALNVFPRVMTVKDRLARVGAVPDVQEKLSAALGVGPEVFRAQFHNVEHHRAHLASAFFVSPFAEAALLSVDGFGDFVSTMSAHGRGSEIEVLDCVEYPHSLGLFYTAATQYLGFPHYGDESKVMGLAAYGTPRFLPQFREILRLLPDGRFELNLEYFTHHSHGVEMTWESGSPFLIPVWSSAFADTFGPARRPEDPILAHHQDIAASLQAMLEEALVHLCQDLHRRAPTDRLCLAGGVALNCTFNGKIRACTPFREIYIPPAAADDGTAIGAAFAIHHQETRAPRRFVMTSAAVGTSYSDEEIRQELVGRELPFHEYCNSADTVQEAARLVAAGLVLGWFQGAMEIGPRALGNRSIIVDPRRQEMREVLNRRIKRRELFRPFAPSILLERLGDYFEQDPPSPFMAMAYRVKIEKQSEIPAATHIDGTARVQTVDRGTDPLYWELIKAFERETGTPVVLNTSFNENEPIVCSPADALECFLKTGMDAVVLGRFMVLRSEINVSQLQGAA